MLNVFLIPISTPPLINKTMKTGVKNYAGGLFCLSLLGLEPKIDAAAEYFVGLRRDAVILREICSKEKGDLQRSDSGRTPTLYKFFSVSQTGFFAFDVGWAFIQPV